MKGRVEDCGAEEGVTDRVGKCQWCESSLRADHSNRASRAVLSLNCTYLLSSYKNCMKRININVINCDQSAKALSGQILQICINRME